MPFPTPGQPKNTHCTPLERRSELEEAEAEAEADAEAEVRALK